jgi:mannose-6-phosphate isomerase-like protein (cupin superfamily)
MSCLEIMTENIATESESGNGGRQVIRAFGQEAQVLVSSQATGDAFCILRISASPGNVTAPHVHRRTDETFLIESGEVEVDLGVVSAFLCAGRFYFGFYPSSAAKNLSPY